jgi:N-acyl-D-amino-acid deacylase
MERVSEREIMPLANGEYDVVVRNGLIVDGTSTPAFKGDVGIRANMIAAIGPLGEIKGKVEIDASSCIVSPGFIDVHAHDDAEVIIRPDMRAKITQGVTTVICGNCGISAAPFDTSEEPTDLLRLVFKSSNLMAPTLGEYLAKVAAACPAVNAAFLTGHTTLRMQVMRRDLQRPASTEEIGEMRKLLTESLAAGSIGLSTGLFYPAARAAPAREVIEIGMPLRQYGGVYVSHMRDEADGLVDSVKETLAIGRRIGAPVVISHHKCMGVRNFGRSKETLAVIRRAQKNQRVALDLYPYDASSTVLNRESVVRARKTVISWSDTHAELAGRDLAEAAAVFGCAPEESISRLLPAGAIYFCMHEEDVRRILSFEGAMIGSDGLPGDQHPHPRLWGTFPRVLARYVREQKVLRLEDAVRRMTGMCADEFGIGKRGYIRIGNYADLCVFEAAEIRDMATYEDPQRPAVGIRAVLVNGKIALEEGHLTGSRAGVILRRLVQ